ncbi:cation-transporting P-type ATPase [Aurantimonas endophytica]|uniref:Magnesium-transporting ATPase (P-type) n=1 Tax=Aurantimonas endophytica TaxID=1522175 RepID=A0A7W6MQY8_9HYPH|nr:cation-transporting P-type ATPase [Aurantimonas endophytica]MBB4004474.1 magnesium-transporting ATPase (P-type) [Aurantimonas endophytica]MCO6405310.1 HAD-IC family P-type ATPase [Aurantimonas endophytica]
MNDATPHHALEATATLAAFDTAATGLSQDEAARRLQRDGPNRLPAAPKRSPVLRFLRHFNNVLIYVLIAAAIVTAVLGHFVDTAVILVVVIANAVIGFVQEGRAEQAMAAIRDMLAPHTSVLRDGERRTIDSAEVVVGDVVLLEAGEKVPADLRLIEAKGLLVQEAILTGESVPVDKDTAPAPTDAPLGDRTAMAFSGTLVAAGTGRGVVIATGAATEIGRISGMLSTVETLTTPLVQQMDRFSRWLTVLILLIAAILLAFGYFLEHFAFADMFMIVVGISVAAIPEGLPAVLTITLAVGVQAMARRNAIVRRLPAIETLGAVSVICTDKTGTLTRNEMMVASVVTAGDRFEVEGAGYAPEGAIRRGETGIDAGAHEALGEIARAAALCNDAVLRDDGGSWTIQGDPMEGALLALSRKIGGISPRGEWRRADEIPFDARHRYMATLDRDGNGAARVSVKGAPERILAMCAGQRGPDDSIEKLDEHAWNEAAEAIAAKGQRVLAIATRSMADGHATLQHADLEGKLVLVGLVGLIDPPRPEAIAAVAQCRQAGIRVKMITGDHAGTAAAIGRQIGLENPDSVLTGTDLDMMDDAALGNAVAETDIFARTSPEHKLRLVTALQSRGLTVAMTGDGVNDAPALKRADAGIAMGLKGSEAAKEAAGLVLADDNFASIVAAVREGRTVYDNIKKVISWTLPTNAGEALTIIVALLFSMSLPVTAIQILWINLVTSITLGIALAFEPTEENTMRRPPRPRGQALLSAALTWHIVLVALLFLAGVLGIYAYAVDQGYSEALARTMAVNTIVVLEIFHLFFIRNLYGTSLTWAAVRGTKMVWATVLLVTAAQFAFTYLPVMQTAFGTVAVPVQDGMLIVGIGIVFFAVIEVEKQLRLALLAGRA